MERPYDPESLNKYAYVRNDPVNYIDPDGNTPFAVFCWLEPGYVDYARDRNVGATLRCYSGIPGPPVGPLPARLDRDPLPSKEDRSPAENETAQPINIARELSGQQLDGDLTLQSPIVAHCRLRRAGRGSCSGQGGYWSSGSFL